MHTTVISKYLLDRLIEGRKARFLYSSGKEEAVAFHNTMTQRPDQKRLCSRTVSYRDIRDFLKTVNLLRAKPGVSRDRAFCLLTQGP